jgi:hypothetical protein
LKKLQDGESAMNSTAKEPPSTAPKQQHLPDGQAMQILVRDAQEKLALKGISRSSASSPNDWIVERLRPPSPARGTALKQEHNQSQQQQQHENWLRIPSDDPPEEGFDNEMPDRQPLPETMNANRKRAPIDPPDSKQDIVSVAITAEGKTEEGTALVAGAYSFRPTTAPQPPAEGDEAENVQETTDAFKQAPYTYLHGGVAQRKHRSQGEKAAEDLGSPVSSGDGNNGEITASVVVASTPDTDPKIEKLTEQIEALRQQLDQIPSAEVVDTRCQCAIL